VETQEYRRSNHFEALLKVSISYFSHHTNWPNRNMADYYAVRNGNKKSQTGVKL